MWSKLVGKVVIEASHNHVFVVRLLRKLQRQRKPRLVVVIYNAVSSSGDQQQRLI